VGLAVFAAAFEPMKKRIEAMQMTAGNQAGRSFGPFPPFASKGHTPALDAEFNPDIGGHR
jgi:hypothetical protein